MQFKDEACVSLYLIGAQRRDPQNCFRSVNFGTWYKLYFYDTGLACTLLGIENVAQLETHYLKGGLFENLVILEVLKHRYNKGKEPNIYFWRDRAVEIDLVCEWGWDISAVEIKPSATFQLVYLKNLQYFDQLAGKVDKYLVFDGNMDGKCLDVSLTPLSRISDISLND